MEEYILVAVWFISLTTITVIVTQWMRAKNRCDDYIDDKDYTFRDFYTKRGYK